MFLLVFHMYFTMDFYLAPFTEQFMEWERETDATLVLLCQQGRSEVFDEIDRRYRARIRALVARRWHLSEFDADEIAQKTLIRAFDSLKSLACGQCLASWLYRIAARLVLDERRRTIPLALDETAVTVPDSPQRDPTRPIAIKDECENVWRLARKFLTKGEFALLWLKYAEEREDREIAALLQKSPGAVRVALSRARKNLISVLPPKNEAGPELK